MWGSVCLFISLLK
uniref:Uncharacterized protein n=1 Tax=Anguilla anguilla TaxID=7936 RepID=A0A0E9TZG3_ANGAN